MTEKSTTKTKKTKTPSNHYVDNAVFYQEMTVWVKTCEDAFDKGEVRPQLTDSLGGMIIKVCEGVAYRYNFNNYSYRDEFALDAIENCVRYAHKFNYEKYKSPYSYFSRIAWQASVRRLQKEDKLWKTKIRYIMNAGIEDVLNEIQDQDSNTPYDNEYVKFLQKIYDEKIVDVSVDKKQKRTRTGKKNSLETYFDDDDK